MIFLGLLYSLHIYFGYQIINNLLTCAKDVDLNKRIEAEETDIGRRAIVAQLITCADNKNNFIESILFNKEEAIASIKFHKSK